MGGKHISSIGELKKSKTGYTLKTKKGSFPILKKQVFAIGKDKPLITINEK